MAVIEWKDDFSTGNAAVDHEHKTLIGLLNQLFALLEDDGAGDDDETQDLLEEVNAAIGAHFALEEAIMRARKYDELARHKADHERLLDEIRGLMDEHRAGSFAWSRDALGRRLNEWFVEHFRTLDSRLHQIIGDG